jgi:SAM-dependent methyltransferase
VPEPASDPDYGIPPAWPWAVVERDHELQNPTSAEKIRQLGEHLRLGAGSRVLDLAAGAGGPARILARAFRCHVTCVELLDEFVARARASASAVGLQQLIDVRQGDARDVVLVDGGWDVAMCLGAAFVWGHVGDAAAVLAPAVPPGGHVAIGEPYWRRWPLPEGANDHGYVGLEATVERFETSGLALTGLIASSEEDWDRYESLHWRALEEWLAVRPDDAEHAAIRAQHESLRRHYVAFQRAWLGWAIFVGRRP